MLLNIFKDRDVVDLPLKNMGSFSPVAFAATMPVSQALLFLPLEHFPSHVLVGRH